MIIQLVKNAFYILRAQSMEWLNWSNQMCTPSNFLYEIKIEIGKINEYQSKENECNKILDSHIHEAIHIWQYQQP